MRLPIVCFACQLDGKEMTQEIKQPVKVMEVRDDGLYVTVCPSGHNVVIILQQLKFEVLFEIGAYAIADGYYREAVSSFTSSLERFYEFVIRALLHARGVPDAEVSLAWQNIAKQSERQLGAFIALYVTEFLVPPKSLNNRQVTFRNDVIHRGIIPTREQAIRYGQEILDLIRPAMREVQRKHPDTVRKVISDYISHAQRSHGDPNQRISTMHVSTIISLAAADPTYDERSLEDAVSTLIRWDER
jgi:polyhydroxyalkanoate synthesis regulator phasin